MIATKADKIIALGKAIQDLQDERDMLYLSSFITMGDFLKVEDELIAKIDDLYIEIRSVLENQDILKYIR